MGDITNITNEIISKKEELKFYSIEKLAEEQLVKYLSAEGIQFPLVNIRGIVIHQLYENKDVVKTEFEEMVNKKINPFHFIIDTEGKIYQVNPIGSAVKHCRSKKYTTFANEYFGDMICPSYEETPSSLHPEASPDNCTISISIPLGKMTSNVINSLVKLCAYIINKYGRGLNGVKNVLAAYEISDSINEPECLKDDQEFFVQLKYEIEKLRSRWILHYGGPNRGYPTEHVFEILPDNVE